MGKQGNLRALVKLSRFSSEKEANSVVSAGEDSHGIRGF
jgi:hypothetical protein